MDRSAPLIAVVEDDDSVRKALGRLLRSAGLSAGTYASGEEFLNAIKSCPPGCVLLDLQLPGISGMEVLCTLRQCGLKLPVVFVTATSDPDIREQAMRSGADGWLCKPVDQLALIETISAALGKVIRGT